MSDRPVSEFERAAPEEDGGSLVGELWSFLHHTKKWWLLPIPVILLLLGVMLLVSSSAVAPFLYTLY
jgi:hypothetical protein